MESTYLYLGIGALVVIIFALLLKDNVKSVLNKKGFSLSATENKNTDNESKIVGSKNQVEQGKGSKNNSDIEGDGNVVKQK